MLDYQNSVEQMTNQQSRNMISYPMSHHALNHHQSMVSGPADGYFPYSDHGGNSRQSFAINPPPLAALHNMAEMKPQSTSSHSEASSVTSYNSAAYYSMKQCLDAAAATPHSITDILSRPDLQAQLQARLGVGQDVYYNSSCSQSNSGQSAARSSGKDISLQAANRSLYQWPNNGTMLPSASQAQAWHAKHGGLISVKDGKKKNTRPTFTGSQIFALEKTFEQQKYLAGPERGRLAFALGMSESQVKVWFQNRRTKWRKRHSAEQQLATTKQRPEHHNNINTQQYAHPHQPSNHASPSNAHDDKLFQNETSIGLSGNHGDLPI